MLYNLHNALASELLAPKVVVGAEGDLYNQNILLYYWRCDGGGGGNTSAISTVLSVTHLERWMETEAWEQPPRPANPALRTRRVMSTEIALNCSRVDLDQISGKTSLLSTLRGSRAGCPGECGASPWLEVLERRLEKHWAGMAEQSHLAFMQGLGPDDPWKSIFL